MEQKRTATAEPSEAEEIPSQKKRKGPQGVVTVFPIWCKGCGLCIEFCPTKVFEADDEGRPIVAHPEQCTGCGWCEWHCPDFAISVRRIDGKEGDDGV
ncbi:MAG: 4Fe-4S binding protein [Anaerolineae bacterium]|jgi:2-oxoglutarate ferredoxin oxidoreductase subunit delta|nr:4Fe-4S binding protein [Anaerolineae bacterium]MDH7475484.1 4Fe-4S binding protein [Anaerolineae bacterium]